MSDDASSARGLFERSLEQSMKLKYKDGIAEAKRALRRLDRPQLNPDSTIKALKDQKST
jgi:hypothetical protein